MNQDIARIVPNVRQMQEYTNGGGLPPVRKVEFKPGKGPGRPPKGREAIVVEDIEQVRAILRDGKHKQYRRIVVTFHGDCHHFPAEVEQVYEKVMLVVKGYGRDLGIVASVSMEAV